LRRRGLQPYFPFLQPEIVQLSARLHPGEVAVDGGSKGLERLLLSRSVPREYVFRPRTGFVLPFHTVFADLGIRAFVYDVALSSSNPLLDFCRVRVVCEMVQRLERGLPVTRGGRRFLWTLVFTSAWLNQLEK
jgi:hypothetical protein